MEKVDAPRPDPLTSNGFACEATDEDIAGAAFAGVEATAVSDDTAPSSTAIGSIRVADRCALR